MPEEFQRGKEIDVDRIDLDKLREKSYENFEKGEEYIISQKQLVDIVVGMYDDVTSKGVKIEVKVPVIQTSYGTIWLN
jgi:hypothetical protein